MFKSLRTSTKLLLLCSVFVGALVVATYSLVAEKQIAINFVRKELVGVENLEALRGVYAAILLERRDPSTAAKEAVRQLAETGDAGADQLDTGTLERALADSIDRLALAANADQARTLSVDTLTAARHLASRIGDDSNLTLDPDLDSYYVQDIVVDKIPTLLSHIGELQAQLEMLSPNSSSAESLTVGALVLDGMIRSTLDGIERDLQASYRGGGGSQLRTALEGNVETMASTWKSFLDTVKANLEGASDANDSGPSYESAARSAIETWSVSLVELKQLLDARLSYLLGKLRSSLLLNGLLVALSLAFAVLTGRAIVEPLLSLERIADEVGQTQNYELRTDYESRDEIGRLAAAFNAMLADLAAAHEREKTDATRRAAMQSELARAARISTMGEMAASIAHEINQPLAAIVNNANASLRWLSQDPPNVKRARSVLERVVGDGARASEVIGSIRSLLEKSGQDRTSVDVNDLIREVMTFVRADLRHHSITVQTDLADALPLVSAVRIQLQQVLLNLIANAAESMVAVEGRARMLTVRSQNMDGHGILIAVEDNGTGIAQTDIERIFEAFFSTKPEGMGMGLSICRSIVEAHGGRITASPASDGGTVFQVTLLFDKPSQ
ncbi:MAG: ATP-binding protein [Hyphomicrobiales bacterium]